MCTCRRSLLRAFLVLAFSFVTRAEVATRLCGSKDACLKAEDSSGHVALVQSRAVKTPKRDMAKSQLNLTNAAAHENISILEAMGRSVNESVSEPNDSVANTQAMETTTLPPTGMSLNSAGDFGAFTSAMVTEIAIILGCVVAFAVLRKKYPIMYQGNVMQGIAPKIMESQKAKPTLFGWIVPAWNVSIIDIAKSVGLDQALLIMYFDMAISIFAIAGLPMVFIVGPMNYFFGGHARPGRVMSAIGMNNVDEGSWLCWVHALCVWGVVLLVKHKVFEAQKVFMRLRFEWLRTMDDVRANTIMVDCIPQKYQSDEKLEQYFENLLEGDQVQKVTCVKDTTVLHNLVVELDAARLEKQIAEKRLEQSTGERPQVSLSWFGARVDAINYYTQRVQDLEKEVKNARGDVTKNPQGMGRGFVTFKTSKDAVVALQLQLSTDLDEWVLSIPPQAKDIVWADYLQDETAENSRHLLGYGLIAGLFFVYMPLVIGITNLAKAIDLGPLQSLWEGMAPTLGLTVMVMFLPTFILLIFKNCFTLYAHQFAQLKLQRWYFWMQVLFVVFAAAIGQDFRSFALQIIASPLSVVSLLAARLPDATHFYWNYLVLQWAAHAMEMLRKVQLMKFKLFEELKFEEEEAKKHAEPEDQDYYGIGGRSARATIMTTIGLVYGTMSPALMILALVNFMLARLFFGYLVTFAEIKKPDLGGNFWVQCQQQTLASVLLYSLVMSGILLDKGSGYGPAVISIASVIYVVWFMRRFENQFAWQKLSFEEITGNSGYVEDNKDFKMEQRHIEGKYVQPELEDIS